MNKKVECDPYEPVLDVVDPAFESSDSRNARLQAQKDAESRRLRRRVGRVGKWVLGGALTLGGGYAGYEVAKTGGVFDPPKVYSPGEVGVRSLTQQELEAREPKYLGCQLYDPILKKNDPPNSDYYIPANVFILINGVVHKYSAEIPTEWSGPQGLEKASGAKLVTMQPMDPNSKNFTVRIWMVNEPTEWKVYGIYDPTNEDKPFVLRTKEDDDSFGEEWEEDVYRVRSHKQ